MQEIRQTLQTLFPQISITTLSHLGSGNDSNAILVNDEIVFKIPKHQKASDNLKKEILILDLIYDKVPLPTPRVEYSATLLNGWIVIGYHKLNGKNLTKEIFDTFSNEQKDVIAKQIASFLKELHQIEFKSDDFLLDKKKKFENDFLNFIAKFGKYSNQSQLIETKRFFSQIINDEYLFKYKPTLVHNDFSSGNILFDENTKMISAIIDFADAAITDRDNDFLCLLETSDEEYGRNFGINVLKYYGYTDEDIALAIRKTEINDAFWPYEEMLLSEEYNDKDMFNRGLNNFK